MPEPEGVNGHEDWQAQRTATGAHLGAAEVLSAFRNSPVDRLKKTGVEESSGRCSILRGWGRFVFNQTVISLFC